MAKRKSKPRVKATQNVNVPPPLPDRRTDEIQETAAPPLPPRIDEIQGTATPPLGSFVPNGSFSVLPKAVA